MQRKVRLAYIDGLRGVAVAMVMLSHSVWKDLNGVVPIGHLSVPRMAFDIIAHEGFHGVSLFLVVSGFCLSYPALKRREDGITQWFHPREFFARRCIRILPPYYAALTLLVAVTLVLRWGHTALPPSLAAAPITGPNVLVHVLLIHNLTPWYGAINGSFWSLGLEWQWYWVFPLVLALFVRSRMWTLLLCLGCVVAWHVGTHDLWQVWNATESAALPERLFEFCCGIVAAEIILKEQVRRRYWRLALMALLLVPAIGAFMTPYVGVNHLLFGQPQPFYGVAFAALLVAASQPGLLHRMLSSRVLTGLGVVSYSVYLIHQPVIEAVEMWAPGPLAYWFVAPVVGILAAVAAGTGFHVLVERPCMSRSTWNLVGASLVRLFGWIAPLDRLFGDAARSPSLVLGTAPAAVAK